MELAQQLRGDLDIEKRKAIVDMGSRLTDLMSEVLEWQVSHRGTSVNAAYRETSDELNELLIDVKLVVQANVQQQVIAARKAGRK